MKLIVKNLNGLQSEIEAQPEDTAPQNSTATPVSTSQVPQPTSAPPEPDFYSQEASNLVASINLVDSQPELNYLGDMIADFYDSHPAPQNTSPVDSNMVSGGNLDEPVVDSTADSGESQPESGAVTWEDFFSEESMIEGLKYLNSQECQDFIGYLKSLPE